MGNEEGQWNWMMNYCKKNGFPPAQTWAWNRALIEYNKIDKKNTL